MGFRGFVVVGIVLSVVLTAGAFAAIEIVDPHAEPAQCSSCHRRTPTADDMEAGVHNLLGDSIDATCHICHPYDCCRINSLKGHNHASDVDRWDVENFTEPRTLPLQEGRITCITCHYHRMTDFSGPGYRMVRLAKVGLNSVDWTPLCTDCHINY